MPSEPKKPIEKMLEASAKERRATFGSDPKMPNPMRARLHDEIARLNRVESQQPEQSWLRMFWPRIAIAAAMAALLVLGPLMWWRGSEGSKQGIMQVAGRGQATLNESQEVETGERRTSNAEPRTSNVQPEDVIARSPAAATTAAPEVNLADNGRAKIEPATTPGSAPESDSLETSKQVAAAAAPAAPAQITKGFVAKEQTASAALARPGAGVAAAQANQQKISRQFTQSPTGQAFRNNSQANQRANVLNNFQVQQEGNEIRVVDSDGSTYSGKLEPVARFEDHTVAKAKRADAARIESDNKAVATSQTRFRTSGYNLSLKKAVVFEGNYTAPPQQQQRQNLANDTEAGEKQEPARIVGTARVHGEPPVEVDATEVPATHATKAGASPR